MSTIFTIEKLWLAYEDCIREKRKTVNALRFELSRERNLFALLKELQLGTYRISRHICFITTTPTPREIFAADFRDRIVHHLLYTELYDLFDHSFIVHTYANRRNKGTHAAVNQLRRDIQEIRQRSGGGYYLKLDIQGFFRSIDKNMLYSLIERGIVASTREGTWCREVLWLCKKIIFHDPTTDYVYKGDPTLRLLIPDSKSLFHSRGAGLPIGNLTSQFFANIYLNQLDYFITNPVERGGLGCIRYVRYVDDFVMIHADSIYLRSLVPKIDIFLQQTLKLTLHPKKIRLQEICKGIDFLGYFIKPTHILVRQSVVSRLKDKLYHRRNQGDGLFELDDIPMIMSYRGHMGHANSHNLMKRLCE